MKKKTFIIASIILLLIVLWIAYVKLSPYNRYGGKYDNNYSGKDLMDNFRKNEKHIHELKSYFLKNLPDEKGLSFGFDKRNDRFYFIIREIENSGNIKYESGEGLELNSEELNKLLKLIGWSNNEVGALVNKLKEANCIGVFKQPLKGKPIKITYREGGVLGVAEYSYLLFEEPLTDSLKMVWSAKEGYRVLNDSVVFEFGYPL